MKKLIPCMILASLLSAGAAMANNTIWRQAENNITTQGKRYLFPENYKLYKLQTAALKGILSALPEDPQQARVIQVPAPDGSMRSFKVWQTPVMEADLAARYPQIKTFTAVATDNNAITAKFDYTTAGFHAMVFENGNTYLIDPYSNVEDGNYICYYKRDYKRADHNNFMTCGVTEDDVMPGRMTLTNDNTPTVNYRTYGVNKRTYRLALACTAEYASAVTGGAPTKPGVMSAYNTTMNRVNGVYEREVAVTMQLIANTDDLIYLSNPSPYTGHNSNGFALQNDNQVNTDNVIGSSGYDMGHVFSTGAGGVAQLGSVCDVSTKAKGVTGQSNPVGDPFDIDYVAHEMGHQFGATHSFNADNTNAGSCYNNAYAPSAYEPGGGSTLMAYAGICNFVNDLQTNSDAYFYAISLEQVTDFLLDVTGGGSCGSATVSGNIPPVVPPYAQTYYIPYLTPFEFTAPATTDADNTYCWEEWDLGDVGKSFPDAHLGPIFRSFTPSTERTRIFPALPKLLSNNYPYTGEKLPDVQRDLNFRLTVRDYNNGSGSFNFSTDKILVHAINTGAGFSVSSPNTSSDYWQTGTSVNVTWNVSGSDAAPISCANVDILLSTDGGYTWPITLAANTANDGSEQITVPNVITSSARVKVKGVGNIFFDLSNADFKIHIFPLGVAGMQADNGINIYPVPAKDVLYIEANGKQLQFSVINTLGQQVWSGSADGKITIPVSGWAKGMYQLKVSDSNTGQQYIKKLIIE